MAVSDQSLTLNETLFLALKKCVQKDRSQWAPRFKLELLTTPSDPQLITPCIKISPHPTPLTTSPGIFLSLLIFPRPIVHFKQQYLNFKLKLINYLKSTQTHLVLRTMMS